jgi:uncharacterized protein
VLDQADDWLLSRRLLQYWPGGYWQSHRLCGHDGRLRQFSKSRGNDLSTPVPEIGFAGLKAGDRWCLCAQRWQEAFEAGQAPRVVLRATNEAALADCALGDLKRFAVDLA